MMQYTIQNMAFIFGCGLVLISVLGGGIEIKELKIPTLSVVNRILAAICGIVFVSYSVVPQAIQPKPDEPHIRKPDVTPPPCTIDTEKKSSVSIYYSKGDKRRIEDANKLQEIFARKCFRVEVELVPVAGFGLDKEDVPLALRSPGSTYVAYTEKGKNYRAEIMELIRTSLSSDLVSKLYRSDAAWDDLSSDVEVYLF